METMIRPPRTGMELFKIIPEGTLCELINDVIVVRPVPWMDHQYACKEIFFRFTIKLKMSI